MGQDQRHWISVPSTPKPASLVIESEKSLRRELFTSKKDAMQAAALVMEHVGGTWNDVTHPLCHRAWTNGYYKIEVFS